MTAPYEGSCSTCSSWLAGEKPMGWCEHPDTTNRPMIVIGDSAQKTAGLETHRDARCTNYEQVGK